MKNKTMYCCEVKCNGITIVPLTPYVSLKQIAEDLELSVSQIYDIYEGRTTKKYRSKVMPKIYIRKGLP